MSDTFADLFGIEEDDVVIDEQNLLTVEEAEDIGKRIIGYFSKFNDVSDYFVERKQEKLESIQEDLFGGFGHSDELFQSFNMHPNDFDIEVIETAGVSKYESLWKDLTQITATFPIESIPGRNIRFLVYEKNTNSVLGCLRIGSPTLNMKPRNDIFGEYLPPEFVNSRCVNGTVIVPAQPFGYNILGGKLMALVCCSNEVKRMIESKYDMKVRLFETTSLYGSIKGVSQYDGLKPFMRYGGNTESNFPMNLSDKLHHELKAIFDEKSSTFSDISSGSVKLKLYMKMIAHVRRTLKDNDSPFLEEFLRGLTQAQSLTTKKRYYYCDYGVQNVSDVIMKNAEPIYKDGMNPEKFDLENILSWWKKKAGKRFDKLVETGELRTELEFWTKEKLLNRSIDIIR